MNKKLLGGLAFTLLNLTNYSYAETKIEENNYLLSSNILERNKDKYHLEISDKEEHKEEFDLSHHGYSIVHNKVLDMSLEIHCEFGFGKHTHDNLNHSEVSSYSFSNYKAPNHFQELRLDLSNMHENTFKVNISHKF